MKTIAQNTDAAPMIDDLAELRARVADLEADVSTYRELLQVALAVTADVTTDRDRLRARYHALLKERRRERSDPAQRAA